MGSQSSKEAKSVTIQGESPPSERPKQERILLHSGKFGAQILMTSKIETFTLSEGWTSHTLSIFQTAVERVIRDNPILTSRAVRTRGCTYALPGHFVVGTHPFVTVTNLAGTVPPRPCNTSDYAAQMEWIHTHVSPLVKTQDFMIQEMRRRLPLFDTNVYVLGDGAVVYHVSMSHCLGDITTYYMIMAQLSAYMQQETHGAVVAPSTLPPMVWGNVAMTRHEWHPPHYSPRDVRRMTGLPFVTGAIRKGHTTTLDRRRIRSIVLSRDKLRQAKEAHMTQAVTKATHAISNGTTSEAAPTFISSHDVIIATLCQAAPTPSTDVAIVVNLRPRPPDVFGPNDAGNALQQFSMPRAAAHNPYVVRAAVQQGYYYETNTVPVQPSQTGRILLTTSWTEACTLSTSSSSNESETDSPGISTICHVPTLGLFRFLPLDMAIVWSVNEHCLGIVHNFVGDDPAKVPLPEAWNDLVWDPHTNDAKVTEP